MAATNVIESQTFVVRSSPRGAEDEIDIDDFVASLDADPDTREGMREARQWLAEGMVVDLRALRLSAGLSQAQLAAKLGLRQPNVSAIESGKRRPEYATAIKLAQALNSSVEDIYSLWQKVREA